MELGQENPLLESGLAHAQSHGGCMWAGWGKVATFSWGQGVTPKIHLRVVGCFAKTLLSACLVPPVSGFPGAPPA